MIQQGKEKQIQLLLDLQQQAFNVLRECLSSQNELLRFRAALAIVEKVEVMPEGSVYADEILHKQQQDEKLRELTDLKWVVNEESNLPFLPQCLLIASGWDPLEGSQKASSEIWLFHGRG